MEYEKTQYGRWHIILFAVAAAMLIGAWITREVHVPAIILLVTGPLLIVLATMFASMTVRDDGQHLLLRYGPVPVFHKRIRYADITSVEPGRIRILDGWGVHWSPGRGWTYNIWGFGCVKLTLGKKTIRVGSDDVDGLAAFLQTRLSRNADGSCQFGPIRTKVPQ